MSKEKLFCLGNKELYGLFYECPYCKNRYLKEGDNFCSDCGKNLEDKEFSIFFTTFTNINSDFLFGVLSAIISIKLTNKYIYETKT